MNILHYLFIALFFLLAINEDTRKACIVFLVSYLIYDNYILPKDGFSYYHLCALLNLFIGLYIINKHFVVGCLSFLLIPTNLIGYFLFVKYYEPTIYDNISLSIISVQILILTVRSLHGIFTKSDRSGIFSNIFRLLVVRIVRADSMEKDKKAMGKVA